MLTISQFRHPKYHQLHTLLGFLVGALDPANTDDHTRIVPDLPIPSDQVKNFAITTAQQRVLEITEAGLCGLHLIKAGPEETIMPTVVNTEFLGVNIDTSWPAIQDTFGKYAVQLDRINRTINRLVKTEEAINSIHNFSDDEPSPVIQVLVEGNPIVMNLTTTGRVQRALEDALEDQRKAFIMKLAELGVMPDISEDTYYVNVYLHERAYGGPEEGGWYYDTMSPVTFYTYTGKDWSETKAEELRTSSYSNEGRRSVSSVLSEGEYVVLVEKEPPTPSPKERPRYE